jgi:hypothetical protein
MDRNDDNEFILLHVPEPLNARWASRQSKRKTGAAAPVFLSIAVR